MTSSAKNASHFPRGDEATAACESVHCVTCADEAVTMQVVELDAAGIARCIDDDGNPVDVMTDLVAGVKAHDHLLVHAGVALALAEPQASRR